MNEKSKAGLWAALAGVLASPGETFERLLAEERPPFLAAAWLFTGISLALSLALLSKVQASTMWTLQHNPAVTPEQAAAALPLLGLWVTVGRIAGSVLGPWLYWLVIAGLLKLYDLLFSGKGASFGALFAVAVYGYLPVLLGSVILTPITLVTPVENMQWVSLSLASFLPAQKTYLYFLLMQCSPFTWWSLALWGAGGAAASRSRTGSTLTYLLAIWLVLALIMAFIALRSAASLPG